MRLAVDTHNAYRSGQIASSRGPTITRDPISAIEDIYEKYEAFLDKKLAGESGKWFFNNFHNPAQVLRSGLDASRFKLTFQHN